MKQAKVKLVALVKQHRGRRTLWVGTIEQLRDAFSYTLECGSSWNHRIKTADQITTIKGLVSNLNKSYHETQGCCWDPDYVELGTELLTEEDNAAWSAQQTEYASSYTRNLEA